jgi:hypothetical protein
VMIMRKKTGFKYVRVEERKICYALEGGEVREGVAVVPCWMF